MFEGGLGLPLMAIGWSSIISVAGFWAWLETANLWAVAAYTIPTWFGVTQHGAAPQLADSYVGYFLMAGFALLGQWTANFAILRIRRGASRLLWLSYGIAAIVAAVSLHHVYEVQAAPGWRAQVEARLEQRAPDTQIITENRAFLRQVQDRTMGLSTDTMSRRNESVSAPLLAEAQRAERAITAAETRLEAIPELSAERPKGFGDAVAVALALLLALIEFTLNWGIGGRAKATGAQTETGETQVEPPVEGTDLGPNVQVLIPQGTGPVIQKPEIIYVGDLRFDLSNGTTALLNELMKSGVLNEFDLRSKVNSITAQRVKAKRAA